MSEHFNVVIAGAGPVGLVLAYALSAAAIDFVCLDKRCTLFEDAGASLVLLPHTLRVLSQFGIYDELMAIGTKVQKHTTVVAGTNEHWYSSGLSEVIEERYALRLASQCCCLQPLTFDIVMASRPWLSTGLS